MKYEYIKINGKNIKATKNIKSIWSKFNSENAYKVCDKIIYELPIELYKEIPRIVEINNKRFYKADNTDPNLNYFKLIKM